MDEPSINDSEPRCSGQENQSENHPSGQQPEDPSQPQPAEPAGEDCLDSTAGSLSEFAHELGQPLHAIGNYAEACLRVMRSDGESRRDELIHWIAQIGSQADRAAKILRQINRLVPEHPPTDQEHQDD